MKKKKNKEKQNPYIEAILKGRTKDEIKLPELMDYYINKETTTSKGTKYILRKTFKDFLDFFLKTTGDTNPEDWTPRISSDHIQYLQDVKKYKNATVNLRIAMLKVFSRWVHGLGIFSYMRDPMHGIKNLPITNPLAIEKALTKAEIHRLLNIADKLPYIYSATVKNEIVARKDKRPWRDRAIIYTLIGTGMRRGAIANILMKNIDFEKHIISVKEKGNNFHSYIASKQAIQAIIDYINNERRYDIKEYDYKTDTLFLPTPYKYNRSKRTSLAVYTIRNIWNNVARLANVNKTPHAARHAMGKKIIEETGNPAAVQRQLGHKSVKFSLQYARISYNELKKIIDK